jgi:hypothetical protein
MSPRQVPAEEGGPGWWALGERQPERKSASHGEAGYERAANDFYPTEPWVTRALCQAVEFDNRGILWEPACGDGRMAKELDRWHAAVVASDIADYGFGETGRDFLDPATVKWLADLRAGAIAAIVTNPPFDQAVAFITRALELTRPSEGRVAILQRHEFDAPAKNHPLFAPPFAAKLILHKRPRWSDEDKASPRFPYSWYIWDWRHQGPPVLRYLPDPDKPAKARLL